MVKVKKEKVLIRPEDVQPMSRKFKVLGTLNPSAVRLGNGKILLYVRVIEKLKKDESENYYYSPRFAGKDKLDIKIDKYPKKKVHHKDELTIEFKDRTKRLTYLSSLRRAYLDESGFNIEKIEKKPGFYGLKWDGELGIEDSRITKIGNLYVMAYVALSRQGNVSTSYAISNDCVKWLRRGIIFNEQNKDVVLFPERVKEKYVAFERPEGTFQFSMPHMWISFSKDLEHWGDGKPIKLSKRGEWDAGRVGAGPPPIKTDKGWLLIYHGVREEVKKIKVQEKKFFSLIKEEHEEEETNISYLVGAALFDLKNPRKLTAKTKKPFLVPDKKHETGTFEDKKVIFPTGAVFDENRKHLLLYSGAGDRVTTVKKILFQDIMKELKKV
jgi:predicted GH43/DUF377 family glycosyl hydrolase